MHRRSLRTLLSLLVSLAVLATMGVLLSRNKGLSGAGLLEAIAKFGPICLGIGLFLTLTQTLCMILRTWLVFPKESRLSLFGAAHAVSFGHLVNVMFPARAGDVLKAVIATRASEGRALSLMTGAGVILADKVVDTGALLLLILFSGVHMLSRLPVIPVWPAVISLAIMGTIIASATWWLKRGKTPRLNQAIEQLRGGFVTLGRPKRLVVALLIGVGSWACEAGTLSTLCHFQGISVSFDQIVFLLCLLNLAIAVPVSLANLGTFEATIAVGLGTFGVAMTRGLAVATVHHSVQIIGILTWAGSIALIRRLRTFTFHPFPGGIKLRRRSFG